MLSNSEDILPPSQGRCTKVMKLEQASPEYESFNLSTSFIFYFCSLSLSFPTLWPLKVFLVPVLNLGIDVLVGAAGRSRCFYDFLIPFSVYVILSKR